MSKMKGYLGDDFKNWFNIASTVEIVPSILGIIVSAAVIGAMSWIVWQALNIEAGHGNAIVNYTFVGFGGIFGIAYLVLLVSLFVGLMLKVAGKGATAAPA